MKMEGIEKDLDTCPSDNLGGEQGHESLLRLLEKKDSEIVELKEQLAQFQDLLETANSENEKLRKTVLRLSSDEPHSTKKRHNLSCNVVSTSVQVPEEPFHTENEEKPMPAWNKTKDEADTASIADILRETAEGEIQNQESETIHADENTSQRFGDACKEENETSAEYIFDSSSGFYYHPATGYYWDPTSGLFYDYTSGLYYWYNEKSGAYEVHSEMDRQTDENSCVNEVRQAKSPTRISKLRRKRKDPLVTDGRLRRRTKRRSSGVKNFSPPKIFINSFPEQCKEETKLDSKSNPDGVNEDEAQSEISIVNSLGENQMDYESDSSGSLASGESELVSELESGECSSSGQDSDVKIMNSPSNSNLQDQEEDYPYSEAMAEDYPPCIRFIVQQSENLPIGALYIVTCAGGSVGREPSQGHALVIPDTSVSKKHANITYDYEEICYKIQDLGSQNGTMINEHRLSGSKKKSSNHNLSHSDTLQFGNDTKLLAHIHKGHETCEECEPGQVQARLKAKAQTKQVFQVLSKAERKIQQRQELKRIKKKFGLQNSYFENHGASINKEDYSDKAMLRRKLVGSENDIGTQEMPASVHSPITASNKGHKLLAKMGWKEGEGLGRSNTGIAEPINVELRLNQSAGLGSGTSASLSIDNLQQAGKAKRWNQARQRFNKLAANEIGSSANVNQSELTKNLIGAQNHSIVHSADMSNTSKNLSGAVSSPASSVQRKENHSLHSGVSWVKGETQQPPG